MGMIISKLFICWKRKPKLVQYYWYITLNNGGPIFFPESHISELIHLFFGHAISFYHIPIKKYFAFFHRC